jgi:hypothetical protein
MLTLLVLAVAVPSSLAHFIWLVPDAANSNKAKAVFSDSLSPDSNVDIKKIGQTKFFVRNASGKVSATAATLGENFYQLGQLPDDVRVVAGACNYGVLQRGDSKPFLLNYYAKLMLGSADDTKTLDVLTLDIVPTAKEVGKFLVLYQGKPVADAEVAILAPDSEKSETLKTDAHGEFAVKTGKPGYYGLRAKHSLAQSGDQDGKKYEEVRSYATLVVSLGVVKTSAPAAAKPDPAASKLLAEARAARAEWANFPGFTADVEVNLNGQVFHGKATVDSKGKVNFANLDPEAEKWAKPILASVVSHRLSNAADYDTPCAFVNDDADHPLGREVHVLNDEMHSSYRIKDKQIMVVNRVMKESRFSITMQENSKNAEGKFLPANYIVHYWAGPSGELQKTEAHTQTWTRLDVYDLPVLARVITANKELTVRSLTLSNHKLIPGTAGK